MKVPNIDFMGKRKWAAAFSIILVLLSVVSLATKHLAFGLDFSGGTLVKVGFETSADLPLLRESLQQAGYENPVVQYFGVDTDVMVRLPEGYTDKVGDEVIAVLAKSTGQQVEKLESAFISPAVGEGLREQGGLGMLMALAMVMLYIALRFQLKFALGAVVALVHDVLIVLGIFSLMQWDFDLTVLAAVLAVIGYSLNDTIVVSDRIRENFRKIRKEEPQEVINISLNQMLSRTLVTSLTTLLVLVALALFGGEVIFGFSIALIIGIVVGTYSSIYVAASILLATNISKEDLMVPVKEGEDLDALP